MQPMPEIGAGLRGHLTWLDRSLRACPFRDGGWRACLQARWNAVFFSSLAPQKRYWSPSSVVYLARKLFSRRMDLFMITYHFAAIGYTIETQYHSFGSCFPGRRHIKYLLVPDPANKVPEPALFRDVIIAGGDRHRKNITNLQVTMTV